jgi:putative transposase
MHDPAGHSSGNSRKGTSAKTIKGDFDEIVVETRDRNSTFDAHIASKPQTRFAGFDDKILSLYARGMTTREVKHT